jgi:choline kinase
MSDTKLALILAAGNGSRIAARAGDGPKPLVQANGTPLLEHVMTRARDAGIERFVIVVGFRGEMIKEWYESHPISDVEVTWVENPEYRKDNGISVLSASHLIHENFLLLMADHVFETETASTLLRQPLDREEVILAVDRNIESIFDLDDATKVRVDKNHIVEIGKALQRYNALDTGMFLCSPTLFRWLEMALVNGNCSLSDGLRLMAENRTFRAFDIGDAHWQDVDTPAALDYVQQVFSPECQNRSSIARSTHV